MGESMEDSLARYSAEALDLIHGKSGTRRDDLLLRLHSFHFRHNRAYRLFCSQSGANEDAASWRDIPCVPQDAFKHADLRSFPAEETVKTFRTSGTTGEGFGEHHFHSLEVYEASVRGGWLQAGLPSGPFLVIAPHPDEAPHSSLSHMFGALAGRDDFVAPGGTINLSRLRAVDGPVCVLGTALGFLHLCQLLGDGSIRLPSGSTAMETGGYKGSGRDVSRGQLYGMISDKLGIATRQIFNEYGMTELSSQFYACGPHGFHHAPQWARAMVCDPATLEEVSEGQTGILLIYDAANVGSVVGIRTQDLAVKRGAAFELLGRDPASLPRGCSRAADEWLSR